MDDDTTLPLDDTDVTWSVLAGPILGVTADGLAVAGTVTGNTDAFVKADYTDGSVSGSLLVKVLNDLSGGISGDVLPNSWQNMFFAIAADAAPNADPDNDGLTNAIEYALGSDPTDPNSGWDKLPQPMINQLVTTSGLLDDVGASVSMDDFLTTTFRRRPPLAAVTYVVEVNDDLASGSWIIISPIDQESTPGPDGLVEVTYQDSVSVANADSRFMRITVLLENETPPE